MNPISISRSKRERRPRSRRKQHHSSSSSISLSMQSFSATSSSSSKAIHHRQLALIAAAACCLALSSALSPYIRPHHLSRINSSSSDGNRRMTGSLHSTQMTTDSSDNDIVVSSDNSQLQSQSSSDNGAKANIIDKKPSRTIINNNQRYNNKNNNNRRKYSRKLPLTPTERTALTQRRKRQHLYEEMRIKSLNITNEPPSIWSFESLFPRPVWDEESIENDLFGGKRREEELKSVRASRGKRVDEKEEDDGQCSDDGDDEEKKVKADTTVAVKEKDNVVSDDLDFRFSNNKSNNNTASNNNNTNNNTEYKEKVDEALTRMVRDRQSGLTRNPDGSVQFKDNTNAYYNRNTVIPLNTDRLNYFAKKDLSHGKLEEAQSYYLRAVQTDPTDGRAYLGLSRIAQRRGDYEYARSLLKRGIQNSSWGYVEVRGPYDDKKDNTSNNGNGNGHRGSDKNNKKQQQHQQQWKPGPIIGTIRDNGPNPFLLQALGALEQKTGHIGTAEDLYLQALRSRPSHAAAWVSLAQLRTKQLRQGAHAGRVCYQSAEHEIKRIGGKPNAFVYTAWARNEYVKGDENTVKRARELYQLALDADPYCSTAYLQLGAMESDCGNFDRARECFDTVLKFDRKNSRVLQAYAIMESRRPREEVNSRKVLDLFEKALKANSRDAGVYQAYALYVKELGDVDSARDLLQRGTRVDKRHAPAWQAWGVLETDYSTAKIARDVFQQGIWACAQPGGGQSGGRRCARLWQAWGCLEAREGEHAAARRCFSRALDADPRNVAAVTAWTTMEFDLGNYADARSIFQRTLRLFPTPSDDKMALWRSWEIMEERTGNSRAAQLIFQRSMSDSMAATNEQESFVPERPSLNLNVITAPKEEDIFSATNKRKEKLELSRLAKEGGWDSDVWMNNGSIEGKVPAKTMKRLRKRK